MRRSIRQSARTAWKFFAWTTLFSVAATAVSATPVRAGDSPARARKHIDTPMTSKGVDTAPYAVRLRITGFLARQHARDGDTQRALVEFHSMLNVDDPSWPDDENGDALRIARDIEVAQMMTESGFYEHAVRVLQTTYILARVNKDPQASVVERQMTAIADLAAAKGVVVPQVDVIFGDDAVAATNLPSDSGSSAKIADEPEVVTVSAPEPAPAGSRVENAEATRELPELPQSSLRPKTASETVSSDSKPQQKSRLSKFIPSRRRAKQAAEPISQATAESAAKPAIAPDLSPTYCQACAGLHGPSAHSHAPHSGAAHAHHAGRSPQSKPAAKPSSAESKAATASTDSDKGMFSRLLGRKRFSGSTAKAPEPTHAETKTPAAATPRTNTAATSKSEESVALTTHESKTAAAAAERTSEPTREPDTEPASTATGDAAIEPASTMPQEPATREPATPSSDDATGTESADHSPIASEAIAARRQVGVAGQIPNPGILTIEGTSTTLAAILRRAGEPSGSTEKQVRILRSVNLQTPSDVLDPSKDFFCQRVEVLQPAGKELDTPIYNQEVVIVDGTAQKPVYISVMPHFILQIPHNPDSPLTADQIVDQLRVYWPNIREQEIGVLRFEQWSRAAKIARLQDEDSSAQSALDGGDVLYIDGIGLDGAQVLPAARSIARLAGAKIRSQAPAQTAASSEE